MTFNIAILASGSGTNAEKIIKHFQKNKKASVALVLSNNATAFVHKRAEYLNIKSHTFSNSEFKEGKELINCLNNHKIDLVVLAGFLLQIPQNMIEEFPNRIINIHPALLPKYGGKGMYGDNVHKAVEATGEKETGITIHYVNENYDEGDIIFQAKAKIDPLDNYADIAEKVHKLEYKHFPIIIEELVEKLKRNN